MIGSMPTATTIPKATLCVLAAAILSTSGACATGGLPELRDGDIIFHSSTSAQSEALRRVLHSPYTHMGIIFIESDGPVVLEAVGPVKRTPLRQWIDRGAGGRFVIKRLSDAATRFDADAISRLKEAGERYLGLPYDSHFAWSDERIYCSELVWKIYRDALELRIGKLQALREFDLSDPVVARTVEQRYGSSIPLGETVVSPAAIFASELLVTVHE